MMKIRFTPEDKEKWKDPRYELLMDTSTVWPWLILIYLISGLVVSIYLLYNEENMMRVKVGDKWYDSDNQPVCIQVSEEEQRQIGGIDRSVATEGKYAKAPDYFFMDTEDFVKWMKKENRCPKHETGAGPCYCGGTENGRVSSGVLWKDGGPYVNGMVYEDYLVGKKIVTAQVIEKEWTVIDYTVTPPRMIQGYCNSFDEGTDKAVNCMIMRNLLKEEDDQSVNTD